MYLNKKTVSDSAKWQQAGVTGIAYDYEQFVKTNIETPQWVHFGIGNIFRAFVASLAQNLLNEKQSTVGIAAVKVHDEEVLEKVYVPHDNLSLLVIMNGDGSLEKHIIGSISESLFGDPSNQQDWARLQYIFTSPSLQLASFTITEKGYAVYDFSGSFTADVQHDLVYGLTAPKSMMGKLAALMYARFKAGAFPISLVSMDNWARNGEKLQRAFDTICNSWAERHLVEPEFLRYIRDPQTVAFPWTMIDKITPRPSRSVEQQLLALGIEGNEVYCTQKDTHIAAFVNAEKPQYLVIEDDFPNGRPPLEKAGVIFTDRDTVEKVDKMKVCTCLNPLMTTLAVFGCTMGYTLMADEMKNPYLNKLVRKIGYDEGLPVVTDPKVICPKDFIDEAVNVRLTNIYMPDTPQRVATDTSQKVARFGETIKSYLKSETLDPLDLVYIPLAIAGWCRYLMAVDDAGNSFSLSTDPLMEELQKNISYLKLGDSDSVGENLHPILSNTEIFGLDLYEAGLGKRIEAMVGELIAGPGAVANTLERYLH